MLTMNARGFSGVFVRMYWSWSRPPPVVYSIVLPDNEPEAADLSIVPDSIEKPAYALTGLPEIVPNKPVIWKHEEIEKVRRSCQLAKQALNYAGNLIAPGVTTQYIDEKVKDFIIRNGAYPSPLNFKGFPKSISCSVNNVAAHGIPDNRELVEGDIVNVDITVYYQGFHGDCSDTFPVGEIDQYAEKLINVTRDCLDIGISKCRSGEYYRTIGQYINRHAKKHQCSTVQVLVGHGIGTFFHGPPDIYHCLNNYPGKMEAGMIFTIEPCVSEGDRRIRFLRDGWTAVTLDNSRTAQKEHTVLVTQTGVEILTG